MTKNNAKDYFFKTRRSRLRQRQTGTQRSATPAWQLAGVVMGGQNTDGGLQ